MKDAISGVEEGKEGKQVKAGKEPEGKDQETGLRDRVDECRDYVQEVHGRVSKDSCI